MRSQTTLPTCNPHLKGTFGPSHNMTTASHSAMLSASRQQTSNQHPELFAEKNTWHHSESKFIGHSSNSRPGNPGCSSLIITIKYLKMKALRPLTMAARYIYTHDIFGTQTNYSRFSEQTKTICSSYWRQWKVHGVAKINIYMYIYLYTADNLRSN